MSAPDLISRALAVYHEHGAGAQLNAGDTATVDAAMRAWHGGDAPPVVAAFRGSDEHEGGFFLYFAGEAPAVVVNVLSGTVTWAGADDHIAQGRGAALTPHGDRLLGVEEAEGVIVVVLRAPWGGDIRFVLHSASQDVRARLIAARSDAQVIAAVRGPIFDEMAAALAVPLGSKHNSIFRS
jgi:hypothetical protein